MPRARDALLPGALVVSHWVLDWVVHRPDLPLYPGEAQRHGLGLWGWWIDRHREPARS